jgi:hypothetical protein
MQIQIYFCNIKMKHMQHTSETHKTYRCNMCSSTCCTIMEARSRGARHRHRARGRPRSTGRWIASGWIVAWREHEARAKVRDARRRAGVSVPSFARGTRSGARDTRLDVPVLSFGTRHEDTQGASADASSCQISKLYGSNPTSGGGAPD